MGLGGGALRGYLAYHCRLFFFSRCSGTTDEYRSHPIILAIALLGGISDVGRSPFCGSGYQGGGGPGLVIIILVILLMAASRRREERNPAFAGLLYVILPALAIVPIVDLFARLVLRVAVSLLKSAFELVLLAVDDVEIVIGQLAPHWLNSAAPRCSARG